MSDLLSYSIADLLPFSRETYARLFVVYNARFSPAFATGMGIGLAALGLLRPGAAWSRALVLAAFGLCWLWIGWAFHLQTLQPLLWAGELFALAFAVQSGLLVAAAILPARLNAPGRSRHATRAAYALLGASVVLLPLAGLTAGRDLTGVELFGTAPDPTAIATLALAALLPWTRALLLVPIPALWCLVSSAMQYGLDSPLWWLPTAALGLAVMLLWGSIRATRS